MGVRQDDDMGLRRLDISLFLVCCVMMDCVRLRHLRPMLFDDILMLNR